MKFLKAAFVYIPDQVLSTFLLWGMGFVWYRGFVSLFTDPPSNRTLLVVIFIGIALGLLVAKCQSAPSNEKDIEAPKVDR